MKTEIEVLQVETNTKYPKIFAVGGARYGTTTEMANEMNVGDCFEIEYEERWVDNPKTGKKFKAMDTQTAVPIAKIAHKSPETPQIAPKPQEREEAIKKLSENKNEVMSRCSALSNALSMIDALSRMPEAIKTPTIDGGNPNDFYDWLKSIKELEYKDNCKKLGIAEELSF